MSTRKRNDAGYGVPLPVDHLLIADPHLDYAVCLLSRRGQRSVSPCAGMQVQTISDRWVHRDVCLGRRIRPGLWTLQEPGEPKIYCGLDGRFEAILAPSSLKKQNGRLR